MKVVITICFFATASIALIQLYGGIIGLLFRDKEEDKEKLEVIAKQFAFALYFSLLSLALIAMMCVTLIMK